MNPEAEQLKGRLWRLIDGYAGYATPGTRTRTCEVFESFLAEKVILVHSFLDKKFREYSSNKETRDLLLPLSESLKILSESTPLLEYDRKKLFHFFEEFRIPKEREEKLYFTDFDLLKKLGQTVDQICSVHLAADNKFIDLNENLAGLKEHLSTRHQDINELGEILKRRFEEHGMILRYIRNRKANVQTYDNLKVYLDKYSDHLFSMRETLDCFRNSSSNFLNLSGNLPMISLYKEALLFLDQYEKLIHRLNKFLEGYDINSPEEDACIDDMKKRISLCPDFKKERLFLLTSIKRIEDRKAMLKMGAGNIQKAETLFESGRELEKKLDLDGALNFYQSALKVDPELEGCIQAVERCNLKKKFVDDFQKANKMFASGSLADAKSLYQKILKKVPDFEEASEMLNRIMSVEAG